MSLGDEPGQGVGAKEGSALRGDWCPRRAPGASEWEAAPLRWHAEAGGRCQL